MAKRSDRSDPTDPVSLRPEQRLTELAMILAVGVLRMREQRPVTVPKVRPCRNQVPTVASPNGRRVSCLPQFASESGENCLELSGRSRPDGPCG